MKVQPEDPVRIVECLKSLGMTKYEALVYIALLRVPSATASEIHESSSVPRASVYPVLDQLLEKDLVSVSQSAPKRFAALPPDEGIARLLGRIERNAASA
ncbi:MAG: TrmB family transcriptional regulator, partial [Methanoregula sp.]|nr:TrmB family transcriptional regulator [Methanoregula sp.]